MPLKIALLASGRGSNVQAIIQAIQAGALTAEIQCVLTNNEEASVIGLVRQAGLPVVVVPHKGLTREIHEAQVLEALGEYEIDYLVLAGYMRLITPSFLRIFRGEGHYRIINIHPSLLPAFPGGHGYEDAYHYGVKVAGVTVHFVDESMDNGPILLQEVFSRLDGDTLEEFSARGLAVEHQLYPKALQLIAENKIRFRYNAVSNRSYVEVKSHAMR